MNLGKVNEGYSSLPGENIAETSFTSNNSSQPKVIHHEEPVPSLSHYLMSIIHMPRSLQNVCVTNFFCWSAHVCYSLYFTDFVGESVFEGDPKESFFFVVVIIIHLSFIVLDSFLINFFSTHFPYLQKCIFRLHMAQQNIMLMRKAYDSDVSEWPCIRFHAPAILSSLRNSFGDFVQREFISVVYCFIVYR